MTQLEFQPEFPNVEGWYIVKGWNTYQLMKAERSTEEGLDDWEFMLDTGDWLYSLSEIEEDLNLEGFCLLDLP